MIRRQTRPWLQKARRHTRSPEAPSSTSDSVDDLKRLSDEIEISPAIWFVGGSVAEVSNQPVEEAIRRKKVPALVEAVAIAYPEILRAGTLSGGSNP